jgi:multiple sugar transport system permease protein
MTTTATLPGQPVPVRRLNARSVAVNLLLVLCALFFLLPMVWLVVASVDATAGPELKWPDWTLAQFAIAFDAENMQALERSVILALVATAVATFPSAIAAYSFSRHRIPGKQAILLSIVFLSGVPISILIIPVYQMFQLADLLSLIPTAVFLGVTAIPFELYVIKNAIDAIPLDLEEAARIERAGVVRILLRVVAPLCLPGVMAAAVYGFINTWGSFLPPLVLISDIADQPSPVAIFSLMTNNVINYGAIAAYSLVYCVPVVVLYLVVARIFRGGFVLGGAVK